MILSIQNLLVLFLALFVCASCNKSAQNFKRLDTKGLSKKVADYRSNLISDVEYNFNIDLSKSNELNSYSGVSTINFNLVKPSDLTIDFVKGEVVLIIVNNKKLDSFVKNENFIKIDKANFIKGKNTIAVSFKQEFSKTGSGLYKFKDQEDQKTYVYTDFEPYDANMFAPLFDQPNLKAKYTLNVLVPDDWKVISSVQENRKAVRDNSVQWFFPQSSKYSTYIFALHAGPYKVWRKTAKVNGRDIPMGLFARQSVASFVKPEFWFKVTEDGFKYFEEYFSTKYPYSKYDQVLVPDFNSGAMENVAAVTFNERFISRDKKPLRAQRAGLANVILHEMAHMWFGNLVTMNWWNDLWLNESFATFMAYSASFESTDFKESWLTFFNRTKEWAYSEDQWRTTHPIEADIKSTEVALTNFDGITYGKGASSLKQLVFLIGIDNFKKGLATYFSKFSEKNTKLTDFIAELQKNTKEDLSSWTSLWLKKEGLNSVKASFKCKESFLSEINFTQGFVSGQKSYRLHKTKVALWNESGVDKDPDLIFDFKYDSKLSIWKPLKKRKCPIAVYPNWEDHDYVKVILDEKSLKEFSSNLSNINSPLLRSQVWSFLWSMVRMAELKPDKIHEIILDQIGKESDNIILNTVLNQVNGISGYKKLYYYYNDKVLAKKRNIELADFLKQELIKSKDLDTKKILFEKWVFLSTEESLQSIKSCLSNCDFNLGFNIDPDRRWWLIQKLAIYRDKDFKKFLDLEIKRDKTRNAELAALAARVLYSKDKEKWLNQVFNNEGKKYALKEKVTILRSVAPETQRGSYKDLIKEAFTNFSSKLESTPSRIQRTFAFYFAPYFCGKESNIGELSNDSIRKSNWSPSLKKALLQGLDREERCKKVKDLQIQ